LVLYSALCGFGMLALARIGALIDGTDRGLVQSMLSSQLHRLRRSRD
jgi:hypothetical protein